MHGRAGSSAHFISKDCHPERSEGRVHADCDEVQVSPLRCASAGMTKVLVGPEEFDLLTYFLGQWTLDREVVGVAVMKGVTTFTPAGPDTAEYFEEVSVHLADGQVLHGEQRYVYERISEGIAVYFHPSTQDGVRRLFHDLHFAGLRAEARHLCKEDLYRTTYVIDSRDAFTVRHVVRGPRKDYVLHTRYQRV